MEYNKVLSSDDGSYDISYLYLLKLPGTDGSYLAYEIKNDTLEIRSPAVGPDHGYAVYVSR